MVTQILPNYTGSIQPCSYAGFAPLDPQNKSALFYWYFPHQSSTPDSQVPLLVWFQGGPGSSSMFGMFLENGPFTMEATKDGGYKLNYVDENGGQSWAYYYNVLFLDQPVDVGFSYTSDNSYPTNEDQVASQVWTALQYFVNLHPETKNLKWYYTGESYAGRYVPANAYWTLKFNDQINAKTLNGTLINLKGVLIGDGLYHGVNQRITEVYAAAAASLIAPYQWPQAMAFFVNCQIQAAKNDSRTLDTCNAIPGYIRDISGIDVYAINLPGNVTDNLLPGLEFYLNNPAVISALHVTGSKKTGQKFVESSQNAYNALAGEIMFNHSLSFLNSILTRIPCLLFEGNFDAKDGSLSAYKLFPLLGQPYSNILNVSRNIWYIQGIPQGFWSIYQNLTHVIFDSAGHFVPYFNLPASVKMIEIFTMNNNNWDPYRNTTPINQIMCNYMNNCSGNGQCNSLGVCACKQGFGLADCSAKATPIATTTYTLQPRDYLFASVQFTANLDQILQFTGDGGLLEIHYTGTKNGPIADSEEADFSIFAVPGWTKARTIYLNASPNGYGYLTIHNTDYWKPVTFTVRKLGLPNSEAPHEKSFLGKEVVVDI